MKPKLPRSLDLAIKRLAHERARRYYEIARGELMREAAEGMRSGVTADALADAMQAKALRESITGR